MADTDPNQSASQQQPPPGRPPVDPSGAASPPPPPPGYGTSAAPVESGGHRRDGWFGRIARSSLLGLLLLSVILNVYMGVLVYRMSIGPTEAVYQSGESDRRIVILPVEGMIVEDTYTFVRRALTKLRDDPPGAIVLRVESPGGGVGASDRILDQISRFRAEMREQGHTIPVIASFGSYAASGGYYVSMQSDRIYAEPTTITGSIGVIAQAFTMQELMQNIGVTPEVITSTDSTHKDMLNTFQQWDEADRTKLRNVLDVHYEQFVSVVEAGRSKLNSDEVRTLATGEMFTAETAVSNGLIDELGYITDAIDAAAEEAGIEAEPHVTMMRPAGGISLLGLLGVRSPNVAEMTVSELADRADVAELSPGQVRNWVTEASLPRAMYLAPIGAAE